MIYQFDDFIPVNILKDNPQEFDLKVTNGLVHRVEVIIPPGSLGLTGVRIFVGAHQLWPSTSGKWFFGDGIQAVFDDLYMMSEAPYIFKIQAYNEDDTYSHRVIVRLGMVSKHQYMARFLPFMVQEEKEKELEQVKAEQERQLQETKDRIFKYKFFGGGG